MRASDNAEIFRYQDGVNKRNLDSELPRIVKGKTIVVTIGAVALGVLCGTLGVFGCLLGFAKMGQLIVAAATSLNTHFGSCHASKAAFVIARRCAL